MHEYSRDTVCMVNHIVHRANTQSMLYLLVEVMLYQLANGETVRYRRLSLQGRLVTI